MRSRLGLAGLLVTAVVAALGCATNTASAAMHTNPLAGKSFYADAAVTNVPRSQLFAAVGPDATATTDVDATANSFISGVAQAFWLTNNDEPTATVATTVKAYAKAAQAAGQIPVFVTYAIPGRDCGSYSSGGFATSAQYHAWNRQIALGLANRPAVVIVEPDALTKPPVVINGKSYGDCQMTATQTRQRYLDLHDATTVLGAVKTATVYLDAGHAHWWWSNPSSNYDAFRVTEIAARLRKVGVSQIRGFALNTSNFYSTADEATFGEQVSRKLAGDTGYVVDTSRNGNGPDAQQNWCNPAGRALGELPTSSTGYPHADAYLWVKHPGESDGSCHGGDPISGRWFQSYADDLYTNSTHS